MPMGGVPSYKRTLLNVNIDSIATLREVRGENESNPVKGAIICESAGCDGITVSLWEDRHQLQDSDIFAVRDAVRGRFNLRIPLSGKLFEVAQKVKPTRIILVPEESEGMIRGGGLDVRQYQQEIRDAAKLFREQDIPVSLLIEPDREPVELAKDYGADFVELHTGAYCNAGDKVAIDREINRIYNAANFALEVGIKVGAGHGLNYTNIVPVLDAKGLLEVTVGHSIISMAASAGLANAVYDMIEILE